MPRGIDLSKFRGDSDSDDGNFPPVKKPIVLDSFKQQTFSHGVQKKTRKELEKEEEERKRKEEEVAAAKAYKEFEDWFGGEDSASQPRGGTSSRGHTGRKVGPGGGFVKGGGSGDAPGESYAPTRSVPVGPSSTRRSTKARSPSPPAKAKGKRVMDSFLEEIKQEQITREQKYSRVAANEGSSVSALTAWERSRGSHDTGDPETSNLFVSNLPQQITEASLGMFFAKYGPVGAVKIMWPRGDEDASVGAGVTNMRKAKSGLSGFVAYMKRRDAEVAVKELDGLDWGGTILRVGWSKMIRVPMKALYEIKKDDRKRSRSPTRHRRSPSRSRSRDRTDRRDDRRSRAYDRHSPPRRSRSYSSSSASSRSRSPPKKSRTDIALEKISKRIGQETEKFVRAVAQRVKDHGYKFEDVLREREKDNPKFVFLRDSKLPEYQLYQFCVDSRYRLPTPPPDEFSDTGKAELYSSDSAEDSERERQHYKSKGHLGKLARKRLEAGLRALTGTREEIARLMDFSIVHADAVEDVAELICNSLKIEGTAVPRKLARLWLISDILHNSASTLPNVWRYRLAFESRLPAVMEHMADVHRSLVAHSGKLSGDTFKSQVAFVIEIWENWIVFTSEVTDKFRAVLDGGEINASNTKPTSTAKTNPAPAAASKQSIATSKFKKVATGGFKSTFVAVGPAGKDTPPEDLDGEKMPEDLDGEVMEDLDGEEMQEDLDGELMQNDLEGEQMEEDLDGEIIHEEDVDGQPMDEDLDGEAM